jgi:hypothetical protein
VRIVVSTLKPSWSNWHRSEHEQIDWTASEQFE